MNPALTTQLTALAFQAAAILLPILLAALLAWLHTALSPLLQDKRTAAWAAICVGYAEQWLGDKSNAEKFSAAAAMFSRRLPAVPPEEVKAIIESAVLDVKQGLPTVLTAGTTAPLEPVPAVPAKLEITHVMAAQAAPALIPPPTAGETPPAPPIPPV